MHIQYNKQNKEVVTIQINRLCSIFSLQKLCIVGSGPITTRSLEIHSQSQSNKNNRYDVEICNIPRWHDHKKPPQNIKESNNLISKSTKN